MELSDLPTHHAVLLVHPNRLDMAEALWQELNQASVAHRFFNQTVLDIDTARSLITWAQTPYNDEKIALISFHTATLPAQNALLKMLEEPRVGVRFILLTSNKANIIGTVLSRVLYVENRKIESEPSKEAEIFLRTTPVLRMKLPFVIEMLAKLDEQGRKDRESIRSFILAIVEILPQTPTTAGYISETLQIAAYAADPSASGKALLEYLSLLLPLIK